MFVGMCCEYSLPMHSSFMSSIYICKKFARIVMLVNEALARSLYFLSAYLYFFNSFVNLTFTWFYLMNNFHYNLSELSSFKKVNILEHKF